MTRRRALSAVIGLGCLIALVVVFEQRVGWEHALAQLARVPPPVVLLAVVLLGLSALARASRIAHLVPDATAGQYGATLRLSCLHLAANSLLPARTGEVLFPLMMRRYFGLPVAEGIPALVWLRLFDLHCLLGAGLFGVVLGRFGPAPAIIASVGWLAMVPAGFLLLRVSGRSVPRRGRLLTWVADMLIAAPKAWKVLYAWTVVIWYARFAALAVVLMPMAAMTIDAAAAGIVAGELSFVLPFHGVAGAGTYEGAIVAVTSLWQADANRVLAAAVDLHLLVLVATLLMAALSLLLPVGRPRTDTPATVPVRS